jgi:hypothetical protein
MIPHRKDWILNADTQLKHYDLTIYDNAMVLTHPGSRYALQA